MRWNVPLPATGRATRVHASVVAVASLLLLGSVAHARSASYPKELHGFWIPEDGTCPEPGQSYDGDRMMEITGERLLGYEEASKPVKVVLLSRTPKAWKIESMVDIGPSGVHEKASPQVFVLGKWTLAVAGDENADVFKRCDSPN